MRIFSNTLVQIVALNERMSPVNHIKLPSIHLSPEFQFGSLNSHSPFPMCAMPPSNISMKKTSQAKILMRSMFIRALLPFVLVNENLLQKLLGC